MTLSPNQHLVALKSLAERIAPPGTAIAVTDPTRGMAVVWPQEAPAIAHAVPKRRREFAAGRQAARMAMLALGQPEQAVPTRPDRAPQWPSNLAGSISHDATSCVAIVGADTQFRALGVDVEPDAPLHDDLTAEICLPQEQAWLLDIPPPRRALLARRLFCAKEAVYKAQYPLTQTLFGFDAIHVTLNVHGTGFSARFMQTVGEVPEGTVLSGQCGTGGGHVLAMVTLGAQAGMENAHFPVCATG
ncbi:4'-phosphopantetheinyl transferase superfamily protein [uncultured Shimia sp.]|uniref:4'-phosphopantetheinyl transferase family protein n=1 Tax=uncultured Shimia sp. TaxID=573152 RepID=UPI0025F8F7B8|nr:4'-phosphopantetheinyl transferase superfamily protein [uncultured Shimia sp.]